MTDNDSNPKSIPADNVHKDPDAWVSDEDPMTGAQAFSLKSLSDQAEDLDAFGETLDKVEASRRIDALKAKSKLD